MAKNPSIHTEQVFEDELCAALQAQGWDIRTHLKNATSYDKAHAIFAEDLLAFVKDTQPEEWAKFKKWHNGSSEAMFVKRVAKQLETHGTIHLLRHGFKDVDAKFTLCQFKPAHSKNPKLVELYDKNRLTVIRQLHYSQYNENSIDLVFFVNGLPVATTELKTDLTQSVQDAITQYKKDRLPKDPTTKTPEPLLQFKTRALVHFAMSTDLVYMTTRLDGDSTYFLPFNMGTPDGLDHRSCGAGNPPAPQNKGYPTYYMWEFVWRKDTWMEILGDFMHLESKEVEVKGKKQTKESLIFPRFHQLVAVKELLRASSIEGAGQSYLIQHSAGSGKSNSIAWTAHRLSNLHGAKDEKVFDTVIVVTDRRVLDSQLQTTISQFEHKKGVVQAINENSAQLAKALNEGTPIVITTLQKFGFILDTVSELGKRKFALIIDEAHSSQTGTAARKLREALTKVKEKPVIVESLDGEQVPVKADVEVDPEDITSEDIINDVLKARQRPENVSYFAFTATPKNKTLELFGRVDPNEGVPVPFHVYSMRQAIEEGFILDVLRHYTSYAMFYQLSALANQKLVPQKKARQALAQYAKLHPHNIAQKVVVIVEHFREHVAAKIGGKAKAMLVTDSRKAAVRYKLAIDKYIKDQGYAGLGTLVAFSGAVVDSNSGPGEFTESTMNAIHGQEPAEAFKQEEYRILLVANKYQVGFDQPLLHTMYVDKRLSGVLAVQTLSRLNRTAPGKSDTFVLDFVNKPEEILQSFQPYYRSAQLDDVTDPNLVHELMTKLNKADVYYWEEVEQFAEAFFSPKVKSQAALHAVLKPAYDRYADLEEENQQLFRKDLGSFLRLYEFLSQIIPYNDPDLEKLFVFAKHLMPRLAQHGRKTVVSLDSDVQLTHYRLQKMGERKLDLESGEVVKLAKIGAAGTGAAQSDEQKELSEIVKTMNDLFSGDITESDFLGVVTTWRGRLMSDESLAAQAKNNPEEQFSIGTFKDAFMDVVIDSQDAQNAIADQMLKNPQVFAMIQAMVAKTVWKGFQAGI